VNIIKKSILRKEIISGSGKIGIERIRKGIMIEIVFYTVQLYCDYYVSKDEDKFDRFKVCKLKDSEDLQLYILI
jgi:hypothetical protein